MLIEKAMTIFGVTAKDIRDVVQSKNLLETELKLSNGMTLKVNHLTNKSTMKGTK